MLNSGPPVTVPSFIISLTTNVSSLTPVRRTQFAYVAT